MEGSQGAWKYPEVGIVKLNVGSFSKYGNRELGLGIIVRNNTINTVQAWSITRDALANPMVAKVDVVRVLLLVVQQNGWRNVEIKVDI